MTRLSDAFRRVPLAHRGLHDVTDGAPRIRAPACAPRSRRATGSRSICNPAGTAGRWSSTITISGVSPVEQGPIRGRDAAELATIPLAGGDEGIPICPRYWTRGGARAALVELKDQHGQMGDTDGTLEEATARALDGYAGPVAVMSFNPPMVTRMAKLAPDVPRGIVTCGFRADDWPHLTRDPGASARIPDLHQRRAVRQPAYPRSAQPADRRAARRGATILCWTVRSAEEKGRRARWPTTSPSRGICPRSRLDPHHNDPSARANGTEAMDDSEIKISLHERIADIPAPVWDACACPEEAIGGRAPRIRSPRIASSRRWKTAGPSARAQAGIRIT